MRKAFHSPRLRHKKRRERARKIFFFVFLLFALVGGGAYALSLPSFAITQISVAGDSALPQPVISAFLKKELSGEYLGFIPQANILLYPRSRLEDSLLSEFPLLASAELSSYAATLTVSLADRKPAALWCYGDTCFFMDKSGFLFSSVSEDFSRLFYRFESEEASSSPSIGDRMLDEKRLGAIFEFLNRLDILNLDARIVQFRARHELEVTLQNNVKLLLEDDGDFAPELGRFETLLSEKDLIPRTAGAGLNIEYIDLRHGNKIYFKPR